MFLAKSSHDKNEKILESAPWIDVNLIESCDLEHQTLVYFFQVDPPIFASGISL